MILDQIFFGNSVTGWLSALGIFAACFVGLKILLRFLSHRLSKLAERTATNLDDLIVAVLRKTRSWFLLLLALQPALTALTLAAPVQRLADAAFVLALLVQGGIWASCALSFWLGRVTQQRMEEDAASATTLSALNFVGRLVLWSIILLLALDNLGFDITALVTGLGIGGIAVALALQNILGDLFASLSIVLDKPFVIGDFIIVNEYLGTVERIGLKTTRLRSLSGEQIVFSNADLLNSRVRNFKRMYERRVVFSVGVTYQTPHEKLQRAVEIIRDIVVAQHGARLDRVHFKEFTDSALLLECVYYVTSPDFNTYMDIQQAINLEIYRRFGAEGIEFAYPTRTLHLVNAMDNPRRGVQATAYVRGD